jgi:uncharacterized protein (UPF0147 family)
VPVVLELPELADREGMPFHAATWIWKLKGHFELNEGLVPGALR